MPNDRTHMVRLMGTAEIPHTGMMLINDNQFSPTFGQPAAFVDTRRAMFGVRLNVGR